MAFDHVKFWNSHLDLREPNLGLCRALGLTENSLGEKLPVYLMLGDAVSVL